MSSNPAEVIFAINLQIELFIGGLPLHFYCAKPTFTRNSVQGPLSCYFVYLAFRHLFLHFSIDTLYWGPL